jgi:t-SNARE complex subunit (syntaxin)
MIESLKRVGLKHEIESRCKEFDQVEIDLAEIDKAIKEDEEIYEKWSEFVDDIDTDYSNMIIDENMPMTPTKNAVEKTVPGAPIKASLNTSWFGDLEKLRTIEWADLL